MRSILVLTFIGLSACSAPTSDAAFCGDRFTQAVSELDIGLRGHPETHDDVGEPGTDVVRGHRAGCTKFTL